MTNNNIAIEIIEQEMIRTKESFEFWAEESNGHQNNLATKLAKDNLDRNIELRVLLDKIKKAIDES